MVVTGRVQDEQVALDCASSPHDIKLMQGRQPRESPSV
jgi:hypothetical protein